METITLCGVLQVFPVVEPKIVTRSAVECVMIADKMMQKDDNQILRGIPIEYLKDLI